MPKQEGLSDDSVRNFVVFKAGACWERGNLLKSGLCDKQGMQQQENGCGRTGEANRDYRGIGAGAGIGADDEGARA
ncbi:MAG: hypothetical protein BWY71_01892 [Planctomycetes bacterium ADurb.Bin412]|nr:MAG: hypothetical protein BWY71_01892 [Planctomycetes bacterium ADurb.Bin412]